MSTPAQKDTEANDQLPTSKRSVLLLIAMLLVVLTLPALFDRTHIPEPFDQSALEQFNSTAPNIVFLGNSLLDTRIDPDYMADLTDENVVSLAIDGTAPGIWYLQLKNIVAKADSPPEQVFIFFHDDLITRQIYFTGSEDQQLQEKLTHSEPSGYGAPPAADESPGEKIRNAFISIYPIAKSPSKRSASPISSIGARLVGSTLDEVNLQADKLFTFANKRAAVSTVQQPKFHGTFDSMIEDSFLPLIMDVIATNDIDLTIVRVATRPNDDGSLNEPEVLANYSTDLAVYLRSNNVRYIDMTSHVENGTLDAAMYYDGYHLKHRFRETYTEFFAEWLQSDTHGSDEAGTSS